MKELYNNFIFTGRLLERIRNEVFGYYDLWILQSYEFQTYEHISGSCNDFEKFRTFIIDYSEKDYPADLLLVFGNSEKKHPTIMRNKSKQYLRISFLHSAQDEGQVMIMPQFLSRQA